MTETTERPKAGPFANLASLAEAFSRAEIEAAEQMTERLGPFRAAASEAAHRRQEVGRQTQIVVQRALDSIKPLPGLTVAKIEPITIPSHSPLPKRPSAFHAPIAGQSRPNYRGHR